MQAETAFTLLLSGYALGLTFAFFVMMGRRQTQPPTVVVQQVPGNSESTGCGAILLLALVTLVALMVIGAFAS